MRIRTCAVATFSCVRPGPGEIEFRNKFFTWTLDSRALVLAVGGVTCVIIAGNVNKISGELNLFLLAF